MIGGDLISTYLFYDEKDKDKVGVGFSKNEIQFHTGFGLKYYLIVMFLRKHFNQFGLVVMNLDTLLDECGYSVKRRNKTSYEDFRNIINKFIIKEGHATIDKDILTVTPSTYFKIQLSSDNSIFFTDDQFVFITIKEFETIVAYKGGVKKATLFGVYMFIKQFISFDSEFVSATGKISYPSKQTIANALGISTPTIESALSILKDLKMIYVINGLYIENKKSPGYYIQARNGYVLSKSDIDLEAYKTVLTNLYKTNIFEKNEVEGKIKFISSKVKNSKQTIMEDINERNN